MKKLILTLFISLLLITPVIAETKKATLINEYGDKVVVTVDSQEAQDYFGLGFYLMEEESFGVVASTPALFRTNLASKIVGTDTSMTLVSATTRDGTVLMGDVCFTVDGSLSVAEYICGTASGTSITALERGLGSDGITEYSALKFAHRYGAEVKITDFPVIQRHSNIINGTSDFPSGITANGDLIATGGTVEFTNAVILASSTTPTLDNHLATKKYVDDTAISGAPNATESVKGISELATRDEMALGTDTGSTGANLVLQSKYASSSNDVAEKAIVVTEANGYINQNRIDLSEDFSFSGDVTLASTTFQASTTWDILPEYDTDPIGDDEAVRKSYLTTYLDLFSETIVSDTLRDSADAIDTTASTTAYKIKEFLWNQVDGTIRIKFDGNCASGAGNGEAQIYKNGSPFGTSQNIDATAYETFSEDLAFSKNDLIQLYLWNDSSCIGNPQVKNFRLYHDKVLITTDATVNQD